MNFDCLPRTSQKSLADANILNFDVHEKIPCDTLTLNTEMCKFQY